MLSLISVMLNMDTLGCKVKLENNSKPQYLMTREIYNICFSRPGSERQK